MAPGLLIVAVFDQMSILRAPSTLTVPFPSPFPPPLPSPSPPPLPSPPLPQGAVLTGAKLAEAGGIE